MKPAPKKEKIIYYKQEEKTSASGKKYTSASLKVESLGTNIWINGFGNKDTANWKEGMEVLMTIFDKEWNGKTSKSFEVPDSGDIANGHVGVLSARVTELELQLSKLRTYLRKKFPEDVKVPVTIAADGKAYPTQNNDPEAIQNAYEVESEKRKIAQKEAEDKAIADKIAAERIAAERIVIEKAKASLPDFNARESKGEDDYGEIDPNDIPF
jgi:hypothetical protein